MIKNDEDYAIVIGIDKYPQLSVLHSARRDAVDFSQWLLSDEGGGLKNEHVSLLNGPPSTPKNPNLSKPLKEHIDEELKKFGYHGEERIGRRLYFFFSGHGFSHQNGDVGMLMINGSKNSLNYHISFRNYYQHFYNSICFDEFVFILDCCRNIYLGANINMQSPPCTPTVSEPGKTRGFSMLSTSYGKEAYGYKSSEGCECYGLGTRAVLEGLRGKAVNNFNKVTSKSLRDYVEERVPELANNIKKEQIPKAVKDGPDIIFCEFPSGFIPPLLVYVYVKTPIVGDLLLFSDSDNGKVSRTYPAEDATETNPWILELSRSNNVYWVENAQSDCRKQILTASIVEEPHIVELD